MGPRKYFGKKNDGNLMTKYHCWISKNFRQSIETKQSFISLVKKCVIIVVLKIETLEIIKQSFFISSNI